MGSKKIKPRIAHLKVVKEYVRRFGIVQTARDLGMDRTSVWGWVSGRAEPSKLAQRQIETLIR